MATAPAHATASLIASAVSAGDAMCHGMITVSPQCTLEDAAAEMARNRVHCVLVDGRVRGAHREERLAWGVLSDRDLMRALAAGRMDVPAGELADSGVVTVDPSDTVERVAQLMTEHDCSHVIVARDGRPAGIVSSLDIAEVLAGG